MGNLTDMHKLLKRQKAFMKGILVMTEKLYEIQNLIAELNLREIKKSQTNSNKETDLLTSADVCKLFDISQSTLYRMRMVDFPFVKFEGRKNIMYRKNEIEAFMKKNRGGND